MDTLSREYLVDMMKKVSATVFIKFFAPLVAQMIDKRALDFTIFSALQLAFAWTSELIFGPFLYLISTWSWWSHEYGVRLFNSVSVLFAIDSGELGQLG